MSNKVRYNKNDLSNFKILSLISFFILRKIYDKHLKVSWSNDKEEKMKIIFLFISIHSLWLKSVSFPCNITNYNFLTIILLINSQFNFFNYL